MAGTGFEAPPENTGKSRPLLESGAESGALCARTSTDGPLDPAALAAILDALPDGLRCAVREALRDSQNAP